MQLEADLKETKIFSSAQIEKSNTNPNISKATGFCLKVKLDTFGSTIKPEGRKTRKLFTQDGKCTPSGTTLFQKEAVYQHFILKKR